MPEPIPSLLVVGLMVVVLAASWAAIRHARRADREAILQARTERAARTKGAVAVEDPTPDDDIMAVANAVAEPVCTCPWFDRTRPQRGHHISCPVLVEEHDPYDTCRGRLDGHIEPRPLAAGGPVTPPSGGWTIDAGAEKESVTVVGDTYQPSLREAAIPMGAGYHAAHPQRLGPVLQGHHDLHRVCIDAYVDRRRTADHICEPCWPHLAGAAARYPGRAS